MSRISLAPIALAVALMAAAPAAWAQDRVRPAVPFVQVTVTVKGEFAYDKVTLPFQFTSDGASTEGVTRELAQKTTRALDMLKLAGVADSFQPLRQEHTKSLVLELVSGAEFAMREGVDGVPAQAAWANFPAVIGARGRHQLIPKMQRDRQPNGRTQESQCLVSACAPPNFCLGK